MTVIPHLLGMIHLDPLPGSPGFRSMDAVITKALEDASTLADAGFPALMVENFGDAPFFADSVPSETVAAMTRCVDALIAGTGLPVGVNVLRNDALSAMGIAAATGAPLIRVNVLSGVMYTDQGPIVGKSAELLRKRAELGASTEIWADVLVKHATPPPGADIRQIAVDTLERAGADAVIVTGRGTGSSPEIDHLKTVREAIGPGTRLVVGSGANPTNVADLAAIANTLIVGSATKRDGSPTNPVDPKRADQIAHAAARAGLI